MDTFRSQSTGSSILGWSGVGLFSLTLVLMSSLILAPQPTPENIVIALRMTSLTTALPFWMVLMARPLKLISSELAQWGQTNRRYLWLVLTISHLIHLYQIALYYQLGQKCPLPIWIATIPVWLIMIGVAGIELFRPQWLDRIDHGRPSLGLKLAYGLGLGYVWLIFTISFVLGTVSQQLLLYNITALILFLAAAISYMVLWSKRAGLS